LNRQHFALAFLFGLIASAGITGIAHIHSAIVAYAHAAPCYQLTGLAGLLQSAHFIPSGGCIVDLKKGGCKDRSACTFQAPPSGDPKKGNCIPARSGTDCVCADQSHP